jgi:hypothetical protein
MEISTTDILMAFLGLAGLATVAIVMMSASTKVNKREIALRQNARAQSSARD